ncbi:MULTISPECIES: DUF7344 domain-containing protein [Salinibaculum]|uniref:DUF7344 domain-containing protein n=1 Tax=Salinibaculum TaxID=2732368 RepID=UPI0030D6150E
MSSASAGTQSSRTTGNDFSRDTTLEVLSNQRRRFVVHMLKQNGSGRVTVSELTDTVASWENGKPVDALSHKERKRVRNALRQFHLPKMDECGFIEYDAQRGTVRLTDAASNANFYVDSLTGASIPWGVYYLGLSALSVVCLVGLWAGVYPLSVVPPTMYGVFLSTTLTVSSVAHFYDNYYRMRLGARDRPPEVGE